MQFVAACDSLANTQSHTRTLVHTYGTNLNMSCRTSCSNACIHWPFSFCRRCGTVHIYCHVCKRCVIALRCHPFVCERTLFFPAISRVYVFHIVLLLLLLLQLFELRVPHAHHMQKQNTNNNNNKSLKERKKKKKYFWNLQIRAILLCYFICFRLIPNSVRRTKVVE